MTIEGIHDGFRRNPLSRQFSPEAEQRDDGHGARFDGDGCDYL
jgi:hypothetical protein